MEVNVPLQPEPPEILDELYRLFRDYFDKAEKKRRWSIRDDIPWDQCNRSLNPAIADVVETFCSVELYLPDYLSKLIPQVRKNRGRAWMLANWGYEECKHSMVLEDWLLRSGARSEEQIADMHSEVYQHEWNLPYGNARGMLAYTTFQELATKIHYARLREAVRREGGDAALERVLQLVSIDEAAHADFFRRLLEVYLRYDRPGTLDQIRQVVNTFKMPAVNMLAESRHRIAEIDRLEIFNENIFIETVYEPILAKLGVHRKELRRKHFKETLVPLAGPNAKP
jgi:acyl-[acyl-carrier-protein] desaturase